MEPRRYELSVWWSADDRIFVVEVPELPGCMAHGDSPEEAGRNAGDAIDLWIDGARAHGDLVPEPRGRRVGIA